PPHSELPVKRSMLVPSCRLRAADYSLAVLPVGRTHRHSELLQICVPLHLARVPPIRLGGITAYRSRASWVSMAGTPARSLRPQVRLDISQGHRGEAVMSTSAVSLFHPDLGVGARMP